MTRKETVRFFSILTLVYFLAPAVSAHAEEVDFSCMSYRVWGKSHVSDKYNSYDIVVQNQCPGAVFWAMCIERIDPETNKIAETHKPTGHVVEGKKARVNLNLYKDKDLTKFRNRFQEFYVDVGYSLSNSPVAQCHAAQCEREKRSLRKEIRANESAWESAENELAAKVKNECPDTGWDSVISQECEQKTRAAGSAEVEQFAARDLELREQMAAIDPEKCRIRSGELAD